MKALLALALITFTTPAFAELCDDPQTQADINYCAQYQFKRADSELNDVYSKLKAGYADYAEAQSALVIAQRAWVAFRDAECKQDQVAADGGSASAMVSNQCKAKLTNLRVEQLEERLNCKEGDMACITLGDAAD